MFINVYNWLWCSFISVSDDEINDPRKQALILKHFFGTNDIVSIGIEQLRGLAVKLGIANQFISRTGLQCYVAKNLLEHGLVKVIGTKIDDTTIKVISYDL